MRSASIPAACGDAGLFLAPVSSTLVDHQQTENMVSAIDTGVPPTSNSTTKGKETSRYHLGKICFAQVPHHSSKAQSDLK